MPPARQARSDGYVLSSDVDAEVTDDPTDPVVEAGYDQNTEDIMIGKSQTLTDPVCGMGVDPATAAASVEHDATTSYFCSTHCAATFNADPETYAGAAPS